MYIFNLINEINVWRKVRKIAIQSKSILEESKFRVDWIGRIYTVINLPEEVVNQPFSREGYVLMKLREYDSLFLNMGIADSVSPELVELEEFDAYLLILSPDRDYIKFWPFFISLLKTTAVVVILRVAYLLLYNYQDSIINTFNIIF